MLKGTGFITVSNHYIEEGKELQWILTYRH